MIKLIPSIWVAMLRREINAATGLTCEKVNRIHREYTELKAELKDKDGNRTS